MDLPNFTDKIVLTYCGALDYHPTALENPRFEMQGGRLFLTGIHPDDGSGTNWFAGLPVAVAWDTVSVYLICDSVEDYQARMQQEEE
jgi:hypothetical protein